MKWPICTLEHWKPSFADTNVNEFVLYHRSVHTQLMFIAIMAFISVHTLLEAKHEYKTEMGAPIQTSLSVRE